MDRLGAASAGKLEAPSLDSALEELSRRGLIPTELHAGSPRWRQLLSQPLFTRRPFGDRDLLDITQQLASLLRAGLNLDRALAIVGRLAQQPGIRTLVSRLLTRIRSGQSFADALSEEGDLISGQYISMVKAGEIGGSLPDALIRLAAFLGRSQEIRQRVRSALLYPCILAAMVMVTLIILLTVVLPRFEALFAASEAQLPFATQVVLALGSFLSDYGLVVLVVMAAAAIYGLHAMKVPARRAAFDGWVLSSRLTFRLPQQIETSRFLRTVGTLATNGLALPSAMRIGIGGISNSALRASALEVLSRMKEGESLSRLLDQGTYFPKLAVQLTRVGEETGRLPQMLAEAADLLDQESQRTIERLLTLMVPAITIGMGALVAALIGAMLVGILSVNDLAL